MCGSRLHFAAASHSHHHITIMTTLDDKLLGEKTHYYCSSDEDEGEDKVSASTGSLCVCGMEIRDMIFASKSASRSEV